MIRILTSFHSKIISEMLYLCEFDDKVPSLFCHVHNSFKKTCSNTDCVELSTNDSEIILYRIDIDTIC